MASGRNEMTLSVYAPALTGDDGRPLAIVHGMERALPGLRLGWTTSEKEDRIQTVDPVRKPGVPPRGLPALRFPDHIRSPEIPRRLGWLNYWSAAAARAIGFPDPARDADLLSCSLRTETGGWVVRLTDAPLDLDNPAHLDALQRAYERFPEIGGRAAP